MIVIEYLRELWKITSRRNGAAWQTVYLHDVWVTEVDLQNPPEDHFYLPKPLSFTGAAVRQKKVPDVEHH